MRRDLVDDPDLVAAQPAQLAFRKAEQIAALEGDAAAEPDAAFAEIPERRIGDRLLPQPLSPASPRTSPGSISNGTSERRERGHPNRVGDQKALDGDDGRGHRRRLQGVGHEVQADHEEKGCGGARSSRRRRRATPRPGSPCRPVRIGRRRTEPEKAEGADCERRIADAQHGTDEDRASGVGQELHQEHVPEPLAARPRRRHEGATAGRARPRARCARCPAPSQRRSRKRR